MSDRSTFRQATWRRLKKNKGGLFGIFVISLSVLIAIFAYLIAPDPSPDANRQIVEIGGKKPGFRQTFLELKKDRTPATVSFFHSLIYGQAAMITFP
jgi:ABC-type antimicrobial peptide transport system permease subunit